MKIIFSRHSLRRMWWEAVDIEDVREVLTKGERIEEYPDDHPFPSALLLGWPSHRPVHVVAAYEPPETIYVVTCYRPEPEQWDASYRRRR